MYQFTNCNIMVLLKNRPLFSFASFQFNRIVPSQKKAACFSQHLVKDFNSAPITSALRKTPTHGAPSVKRAPPTKEVLPQCRPPCLDVRVRAKKVISKKLCKPLSCQHPTGSCHKHSTLVVPNILLVLCNNWAKVLK